VKEIILSLPYFSDESLKKILIDIESTLRSGRLTDGPNTQEFERRFADYCGSKYAVAVSSCSAALEVSMRYFKLQGREVIVPTNTFIATPNSVIHTGGKPVFADIKADTLCVDPEDVKRKLTPNTAGVIAVHIAGLICPQIEELKQICQDKGLFLLEDCAHAHGAMLGDKKSGTFGDAGCFSFYPTKVMTTCEGGMIVTDNQLLADHARCLRFYGQNQQKQAVALGYNWRMSEVTSVIGRNQLENLEAFVKKRNQVAELYRKALRGVWGVSVFNAPSNARVSYYKYPVLLAKGISREKVAGTLKEKFGVEAGHVYYPPCHLQPYYQHNYGTCAGQFPVAEDVLSRVLCLPMHYTVSVEDVNYVKESLVLAINESAPDKR
jgi:perosamine synthetase